MQSVAETPEYLRQADKLLIVGARADVVDHLAAHPKAGDLMQGTGGVRKLRWARAGRGKSGGVRITRTVKRCRFTCLQCSPRTSART